MTRPVELIDPKTNSIVTDAPTRKVLAEIDPENMSRAIRILASWHIIAADRDERTRTAEPVYTR